MDVETIKLLTEGDINSELALKKLITNAETIFSFPELNENNLRQSLWNSLYALANSAQDERIKADCFSAIRILSRDKKLLNELVEEREWLELIRKWTRLDDLNFKFNEKNKIVSIEAEKSLCNLAFNCLKVTKKCWSNGMLWSINERLKLHKDPTFPSELTHLDVKLLFIITALCPETRKILRDDKCACTHLMEILNHKISKTSDNSGNIEPLKNETVDLVCEVLKALFNLTVRIGTDEEEKIKYDPLVQILRKYLLVSVDSKAKRFTLLNDVINLLTNMPNECYLELTPLLGKEETENIVEYCGRNMAAIKEMLELLKYKVGNDRPVVEQLEIISPTVTVLFKAAQSDRVIRKYLKSEILPPLKDVHTRPEEGSTLRNCLCRLLTSPMTQLRDIVAEFMFFLCKKSVRRMIKYTGYGNAAGLFANRGLLGGREDREAADFSSDSEDSDTEEYAKHKHNINPVLGCYTPTQMNPMEGMTDEEKEYEAMKLVELMHNLTKSGPIKPCRVGKDGKPEPIEHVLQLQENIENQKISSQDSDDSD